MMTREEYIKNQNEIQSSIFAEWSDPLYICPKCNEGGMCQNLRYSECITTIPPIYVHTYRCNKCGFIDRIEER